MDGSSALLLSMLFILFYCDIFFNQLKFYSRSRRTPESCSLPNTNTTHIARLEFEHTLNDSWPLTTHSGSVRAAKPSLSPNSIRSHSQPRPHSRHLLEGVIGLETGCSAWGNGGERTSDGWGEARSVYKIEVSYNCAGVENDNGWVGQGNLPRFAPGRLV